LEAFLCGAKLRLGGSTGRKRPLLTNQAFIDKEFKEKHQTLLWEEYLKFFGLKEFIDFSPISIESKKRTKQNKIISIAPGSSNTPEKRWPIENWVSLINELIKEFPSFQIKLIGSEKDKGICKRIFESINNKNLVDLSGSTNLSNLCNFFLKTDCLICNDSGAMHLANALGVNVYAIFGVTSSVKTGPVFLSSNKIFSSNKNESEVIFKIIDELKKELL
jgi:heptosyltransferase-2